MKLSTRKIIGLEAMTAVLMAVVALMVKVAWLRSWLEVLILGVAVAASIGLLGWAKVQPGRFKNVAIVVILGAILFQAVRFVFLGLKLGFVQNVLAWRWDTIWIVFLPLTLMIVLEEILRGQWIQKGKLSPQLVVMTTITLVLVQALVVLPSYDLSVGKGIFDFVVLAMLPICLANILFSYVAYKYDYRMNVAYRLIMELPMYLLPIWPDVSQYLALIFEIGFVFALVVALVGFGSKFEVKAKKGKPKRAEAAVVKTWKKVAGWSAAGIAVCVMLIYVAMMSGLFRYYFLAIGSGSMEPQISKGDMIVVKKSDDYDKMKEGDVLVYRHENTVMVHRISKVDEDGGVFKFQTKGDANETADKWTVNQSDIIGVAKSKIAMFGYPTLWLNELFNGGKV